MIKNFRSLIPKTFNVQYAAAPIYGALNFNFHSSQSFNRGTSFGETFDALTQKIENLTQLVSFSTILLIKKEREYLFIYLETITSQHKVFNY